jgi:hypothetical protein
MRVWILSTLLLAACSGEAPPAPPAPPTPPAAPVSAAPGAPADPLHAQMQALERARQVQAVTDAAKDRVDAADAPPR